MKKFKQNLMKPINSHKNTFKTFWLENGTNIYKGCMNICNNTFVQGNKMPKVSIFNSWSIPSIAQNVIFLGLIWLLRSLTQKCWSTEYWRGCWFTLASWWDIRLPNFVVSFIFIQHSDGVYCNLTLMWQTLWFHSFLYNM
jgi:hypothetical protein